jgi:hypothetical protein
VRNIRLLLFRYSLLRKGLREVSSEGKVSAQGVMGRAKQGKPLRVNAINMASYIFVCSEVPSTIGGVKTCFRLSFSGVLEYPGVNSISISSSVHLHRKILRNCKRLPMDTSYLIINILLIATFLYKNISLVRKLHVSYL